MRAAIIAEIKDWCLIIALWALVAVLYAARLVILVLAVFVALRAIHPFVVEILRSCPAT